MCIKATTTNPEYCRLKKEWESIVVDKYGYHHGYDEAIWGDDIHSLNDYIDWADVTLTQQEWNRTLEIQRQLDKLEFGPTW